MRTLAFIFALATSAFALQVTEPTSANPFSIYGENTVSWTRVNTDPSHFAIALVNYNVRVLSYVDFCDPLIL